MISLNDFKRLIAPLQRKIYLMIGRAVLTAVNNSEGTQKLSMEALKNETITEMERFEEYGFTSLPLKSAELLALFFNGNRDHGIVIKAHDRRHRPKDAVAGEIVFYTDEHIKQGGHRIHFKRGQLIDILMKTMNITADDGSGGIGLVNIKNSNVVITDGSITVTLGNISVLIGNISDANSTTPSMQAMRNLYNTHTHPGDSGGTTGAPNQTMG